MQDTDSKTPSTSSTPDGHSPPAQSDDVEGKGASEATASQTNPLVTLPELETPRAASISRSASEVEKHRPATQGKFAKLAWRNLSLRVRAMIAIAGGAAALVGAALFPVLQRAPTSVAAPVVSAASIAATIAGEETLADADAPPAPSGLAGASGDRETDTPAPRPSVWRVAQLATDESVSLIETPVGRRSLLSALAAAHLGAGDAARIAQSLGLVRNVERLDPKDTFTVAIDKRSAHVVAYELASSPSEIWQGREEAQPDGSMKLLARKLPLRADHVRVGKALVVGGDLRASFTEAGLTPVDDVLSMLEDALDGHAELSEIRPGARLRLLGTQEQVEGVFSRWVSLDAVEYFPASPDAPAVRVYSSAENDGSDDGEHGDHGERDKRSRDWYDAKGRQPVHGGLRSPVPGARIASRFNPHRMHPVLHVLMPHNGVDLAAPVGTPVYAAAAGTVTSVGPAGPCGNRVEIAHSGGITSVYCHLSRFTQGLRTGMHVEQRQLIAYVGQTGRVTGPHLHFGIRKNGVFVDPMSLRLDGFRVVPKGQRDDFDRRRAGLDKELDGIPLPAPGAGAAVTEPEHETFYEEP